MNEPIKTPESYSPKRPELASMLKAAQETPFVKTITEAGLINFEVVETGPYRFIGKSVYIGNKDSYGCYDDLGNYLWSRSDGIFKMLDGLAEYVSDEVHDAMLYNWNRYDETEELFRRVIGRFMKADTPVSHHMDYVDIPAGYAVKGFIKVDRERYQHKTMLSNFEEIIRDEFDKFRKADENIEYVPIWHTAEVYPKPDANGDTYIGIYEFYTSKQKYKPIPVSPTPEHPVAENAYDWSKPGKTHEVKSVSKKYRSAGEYALPLRMDATVKTDSIDLRVTCGGISVYMIHSTDDKPRMTIRDVNGEKIYLPDKGEFPTDEFFDISFVFDREYTGIAVNGIVRQELTGLKYMETLKSETISGSLSIEVESNSSNYLTVKSLTITEL